LSPVAHRRRRLVGGLGLILVAAMLAWAGTGLPAFGHYHHRYGAYVSRESVPQRGATNSVNVVTFDYRGFDTLGEEFILFIAVIGVVVLLRRLRDERDQDAELSDASQPESSESLRWLGVAAAPPVFVLGAYVVTHGTLSPGGGFQGGVILMAALIVVFLGGEYTLLVRLRGRSTPIEMAEAAGAAGLAVLGFGGLIAAGSFMANFLDKGSKGSLLSGGFLPLANLAVGIEVAGALLMVLSELLDERQIGGHG
jgi:multicomponent Na+:H+ antiporter subunit B